MSVKAMAAVWDMKLDSAQKLVLLAYADHADHDGGSIYPAVATVARKTGYSERQVQRVTRELEALGLLRFVGLTPRGVKCWAIPLDVGGDILSPLPEPPGVTSCHRGGDILSPGGVTSCHRGGDQMSPEPSVNRPLEPSEEPRHFSKFTAGRLGRFIQH